MAHPLRADLPRSFRRVSLFLDDPWFAHRRIRDHGSLRSVEGHSFYRADCVVLSLLHPPRIGTGGEHCEVGGLRYRDSWTPKDWAYRFFDLPACRDPVQTIESVFGEASLVSGDIGLGLTRLEFSSDIVGAFSLFAILCPSVSGVRARRHIVAAMVLLLVISGLISYSRYIWFVDLFAVVAALLIERRFKLLLLSTLAVAALAGVFYEEVGPLFTARFSSTQVTDSDLTRVEQSKSLLQEIEGHPLLGKGMGHHAQVIRSEQNRYSYELQWMSLLMQTGILGVAVILCLIFATARDLIAVRGPVQLWLAALYLLWLLGSWTQPIPDFLVCRGATFWDVHRAVLQSSSHSKALTREKARR